jgi:hypothetical protein
MKVKGKERASSEVRVDAFEEAVRQRIFELRVEAEAHDRLEHEAIRRQNMSLASELR